MLYVSPFLFKFLFTFRRPNPPSIDQSVIHEDLRGSNNTLQVNVTYSGRESRIFRYETWNGHGAADVSVEVVVLGELL